MENELLRKSVEELRKIQTIFDKRQKEEGTVPSALDQLLDELKCRLAFAIILAGGSNWVLEISTHRFTLTKIIRANGGMGIATLRDPFFMIGEPEYDGLRRLFNLLEEKADDAKVVALLTEFRKQFGDPLRTCDNMIAIRGRFFRFVGGKYEVMG